MEEKGGIIIFEKGWPVVEGCTEISIVFDQFVRDHPEAKKHMTELVIPPWTKAQWGLKARSNKSVPNHMVYFLLEIWEIKLTILANPAQ